MLKVGLTGGIGCGKTTVANVFAQLGVPVIDADVIARQVVSPNSAALQQISTQFGKDCLHSDGSLNRHALRAKVFADPTQKRALEAIVHPLIYQQMQNALANLQASYCLLCIPLLFETQMQHWVHRVLVVDCPVELQIQRVVQRDGSDLATVQAIIASQVSREFRLAHSDDVFDNTQVLGDNSAFSASIKTLHTLYLSLSR